MFLIESQFLSLQIPKKSLHLAEEEGHVLPQTCGVEERGVPNATGKLYLEDLATWFFCAKCGISYRMAPPSYKLVYKPL